MRAEASERREWSEPVSLSLTLFPFLHFSYSFPSLLLSLSLASHLYQSFFIQPPSLIPPFTHSTPLTLMQKETTQERRPEKGKRETIQNEPLPFHIQVALTITSLSLSKGEGKCRGRSMEGCSFDHTPCASKQQQLETRGRRRE